MHYFFLKSRLTEVLSPDDSAFASPVAELTMIIPPGTVMNNKTECSGAILQPMYVPIQTGRFVVVMSPFRVT